MSQAQQVCRVCGRPLTAHPKLPVWRCVNVNCSAFDRPVEKAGKA